MLTLASFCLAQWSKNKINLKQWQPRFCQVGALEMLYGSSTGCHSDIEPNSRPSADQSGFVQGIMQELVEGKAK